MKEKLQQKTWFWKRRSRLYLESQELRGSVNKFKGSVFAVILGLVIGIIVIAATGNNPLTYFQYLLFFAFSSYGYNNWDTTLVWWTIFIIAGLSLLVSFKTGMFNIGATGQMLAAGAVVLAIGIRYDLKQPLAIFVALIAGVLAAMSVAIVTIALKVFFNVHEVVTSILLNWTVWYLIKWTFTTSGDLYDDSRGASLQVHDGMSLAIDGFKFILPIIIALILVFFVWFIFKKTTLGYKVKTVGLNPFAADYSGISRKKYAFISFVISGALAGMMGVIYYIGMNPSLSFASDDLPTLGFDGISVALVGQVNAFGVVGAALLWGVIKSGGPIGSVGLGIPNAVSDVIFGVIIYSAACAILFSKFEPFRAMLRFLNVNFTKSRKQYFVHLKNIFNGWKNVSQVRKRDNQAIKNLKKELKNIKEPQAKTIKKQQLYDMITTKKENIQVAKAQVQQERKALKNFCNQEYQKIWTTGLTGINYQTKKNKKALYGQELDNYINAKITYEEKIHHLKESYANNRPEFKKQAQEATKNFNQQFLALIKNEKDQLLKIKQARKEQRSAYRLDNKSNQAKIKDKDSSELKGGK
ncbi:MAG: hypothetical protein REH79_03060 [Spiroplasma sp.]|nr:hypothetical protein [Spiroplasma sp.]